MELIGLITLMEVMDEEVDGKPLTFRFADWTKFHLHYIWCNITQRTRIRFGWFG